MITLQMKEVRSIIALDSYAISIIIIEDSNSRRGTFVLIKKYIQHRF